MIGVHRYMSHSLPTRPLQPSAQDPGEFATDAGSHPAENLAVDEPIARLTSLSLLHLSSSYLPGSTGPDP